MNLNKDMLDKLIWDAASFDCAVVLEISSQGAMLKLTKSTHVAGTTDLSRHTTLTRWLDKNNSNADHDIKKTFHSLP